MTEREKLIELLNNVPADFAGNRGVGAIADHILADEEIKHAFELLKAEKDGRLIVSPCKVGTRVYRIGPDHLVTDPDPTEYTIICDAFKVADIYSFGKTVFLSREQAEKALKGVE